MSSIEQPGRDEKNGFTLYKECLMCHQEQWVNSSGYCDFCYPQYQSIMRDIDREDRSTAWEIYGQYYDDD